MNTLIVGTEEAGSAQIAEALQQHNTNQGRSSIIIDLAKTNNPQAAEIAEIYDNVIAIAGLAYTLPDLHRRIKFDRIISAILPESKAAKLLFK